MHLLQPVLFFVKHTVLPYRTSKHLVVDMWQVGLFYRSLQAGVLVYAIREALYHGSWAYSEVPAGSVNAYGGSTAQFQAAVTSDYNMLTYCFNETYDYIFSEQWHYESPQCERLDERELVQKGPSSVFVVTSYVEEELLAWPCARDDAIVHAKRALCFGGDNGTADDSKVLHESSGQCSCNTSRTVYPVGVEELDIWFEHAYDTSDKVGSLQASSNELSPSGATGPLDTTFTLGGDSTRFPAGTIPHVRVADILRKGGIPSLNAFAEHSEDMRGPSKENTAGWSADRYPSYRTTGVMLQINLVYSNQEPNQDVVAFSNDVNAHVDVLVQADSWAGWGAEVSAMPGAIAEPRDECHAECHAS